MHSGENVCNLHEICIREFPTLGNNLIALGFLRGNFNFCVRSTQLGGEGGFLLSNSALKKAYDLSASVHSFRERPRERVGENADAVLSV